MTDFKERLTALCGYGAIGDFSVAAGMHPRTMSNQMHVGRVGETALALLEWLEATPHSHWPERWIRLRNRAAVMASKTPPHAPTGTKTPNVSTGTNPGAPTG